MANRSLEMNIESNVSQVRDDFGRIQGKIPEVEKENSRKIAHFFADAIRRTIKSKLRWRGNLLDSVRVALSGGGFGDYTVTINAPIQRGRGDYAAWNQFASSGHWVTVKDENRPIDQWAREHGIPQGVAMHVEPTPFMNSSVRQAAKRMRRFLERGGEVGEFLDRELKR